MRNKDQSQTGTLVLILVAMVLGVLIGLLTAQTIERSRQRQGALAGKVSEVMELLTSEYVDEVDADSVSERVLAAILSEMDPHSTYLSVREAERTAEMMRGSFEGVGIVLHREGDSTFVGSIMRGGPSDGSGLLPGDWIATVDADSVCGMPADSVVARLRGPRGSHVFIDARRKGMEIQAIVRRGVVEHHTIACATMIDDTTGYIVLNSFSATSHDEFHDALLKLLKQGMTHLVFDLRGNGGGSLASAIGIAAELLPRGSLIVYTQGAHSKRHDVRAPAGGLFTKGKITVLVDEYSASASEVVSGALQDNDRATIAGRRTFGKGLVQTEYDLDDGSSVLLTTARYYTPSGRCIQRSYADGTEQYYKDYVARLLDETYADSAVAAIADSTPYLTVGGRTVYGGGGIIPDHVLTYQKDSSFVYYNQLQQHGLMARTAFAYVKGHAEELLARYASVEEFESWQVPQSMMDDLVRRGEKEGVKANPGSLAAQRKLIAAMLKANIATSLYGDGAFYDVYLPHDSDLQRALSL